MDKELLFVACTAGAKEQTRLYHSLVKLGYHEQARFFERLPANIPAEFNRVLSDPAVADKIVVFVRDDVMIADLFVRQKLNEAVATHGFTITGIAGSATFNFRFDQSPNVWNDGPGEGLSGAYELQGDGVEAIWTSFGHTPRRCVTLDGALLAVDMATIGALRFDESLPQHFYDLDLCLAANGQGLKLGTMNVYVSRRQPTATNDVFLLAAQNGFRAKWSARLRNPGS